MFIDKPTGTTPVRNQNLDFIKLLSCIAVVMLHCVKAETLGVSMVLYQLSIFAVPCFFMASGYLLLNKRTVTWSYGFRKVMGIARLVILWSVLYCGVQLLGKAVFEGTVNFPDFLRSCVLTPVKGVLQKGELWQFWYLGTLGIVYLALPVLHSLLGQGGAIADNPGRAVRCWCILAAGSVLMQIAGMIIGQPLQNLVRQTFRLWTAGQYLLLGALMPVILKRLQAKLTLRSHGILTAGAAAASLLWRLMLDLGWLHWTAGEFYYDDPVTVLWLGLLFSVLMRVELSVAAGKLVSGLAPLIMGVYIIHVPVRNLIRAYVTLSGDLQQLLLAAAVGSVSFLLAYLIRKLPFGKHLLEI